MTVEADDRNGVSEVEDCEGKTELKLDSYDRLPKLVGERNGTAVHEKIDEIDGHAKDDGDGSYVFVDGADTVSDDLTEGGLDTTTTTTTTEHVVVADHSESLQGEAIHEDKGLSKLNADSPTGGKQVQANGLRVEEGLNSASLDFEDNFVSSSEHDIAVEASESIINGDKVEQTGKVGKNYLDSAGIVEGNQESLTSGSEAAVSELHQPDDDNDNEVKDDERNKLEAVEDADADEESKIVVAEAVVSELHQLNTEERVEDNNKLEAAKNVEGNQESQIRSMETVEPETHQLATREEEATEPVDEIRAENVEGNQESQTRFTETVEPEPHQLAAREEETTEPADDLRLEDNNKIEAAKNVEGNQESQNRFTETVEAEPHQLAAKEEETTEPADDIRLEEPSAIDNVTVADEVHVEEPSVIDDFDSKLNQLNSGEVKVKDESNLNSAQEVEVNQDSQPTSVGATELELHQFDNGEEKVEGENKLHSAANAEEEQQSHMLVAEAVDSELHELNVGEKESEKLVNEALVETHSANLGPDSELNLGTAISLVDGTQLDSNSTNITDESRESGPPCTVKLDITGMEVVNNSDEGHKNMSTCDTGDVASESVHVNGAVENSKSLSCPVDDLQSEKVVENVALENGDSILTDPTVALENGDIIPTDPTYCVVPESELGNGSFECKSIPTCLVDDVKSEAGYTKPSAETGDNTHAEIERGETISSYSLDNTHAAIEFENGSVERGERMFPCSVEEVKSEAGISDKAIEIDQGIPPTIPVEVAEIESSAINNCIEIGSSLHKCPIENGDTESDAGNCSGTSLKDIPNEDNLKSESGVQNGFVISFGSMPNCVNSAIDVETEGVTSISGDSNSKPIREEVEGVVNHGSRPSSPEDPTIGALEGQKVNQEVGRRPFRCLIRIPRYGDDKSREEVRLAQLQVDEKTRNRDAIRATIQSKRAISNDHRDKFEAARSEERAARDALHAKRQELDSVQSVLNKMKNATSIEEIDDRIHSMEHMIEHETMPLKEEKQLIREIKQLKNLREQLCLSLGRQAEEQLTMDQRDKIEERFKILKRELDSTRSEVLRTEGITKAAKKIYFGESDEIKELQAQFRAADDLRQEAYTHLQNLRKQFYEKNKYFRMYKEDLKKAEDLASSGDKEELQRLCVGQVETIMELWNKNDEFRNEYIRCNTMSTLRRLRTLDGRSLGPDEEPPIIRNFLNEKVDNTFAASSMMGSEQARSVESVGPSKTEVKSLINLEQKNPKMDMRSVVHLERKDSKADLKSVVHLEEKNPAAKSNKAIKTAASKTDSVTASGEEEAKEENKQTEEEELARKAEELRKEAATAKLKEQRRLEEKAKAKEAEERKRRNAEKAQARAELRAQKEAELKEKEKERRARKKERKVAAAAALSEGTGETVEGESTPNSEPIVPESIQEAEIKEKSTTVVKRSQKPLVKQTKVKTIPPPLRNRGKRRMQPWMWVLLVVLVIIAFFLVGNSGYPSKFGMPNFRF